MTVWIAIWAEYLAAIEPMGISGNASDTQLDTDRLIGVFRMNEWMRRLFGCRPHGPDLVRSVFCSAPLGRALSNRRGTMVKPLVYNYPLPQYMCTYILCKVETYRVLLYIGLCAGFYSAGVSDFRAMQRPDGWRKYL